VPKFTRQALYDLVWSKSTVQIAKDFGISDVALAKVCKKHQIPKPPLGYWARVQNGHPVKKTPLVKIPALDEKEIEFRGSTIQQNARFARYSRPEPNSHTNSPSRPLFNPLILW
jgi:hypothetical protein